MLFKISKMSRDIYYVFSLKRLMLNLQMAGPKKLPYLPCGWNDLSISLPVLTAACDTATGSHGSASCE